MGVFLLKRIVQLTPTLLLISGMVFLLAHLAPGDPINAIVGPEASPELIAAIRHQYALDQPLPVQYIAWLGQVIRGNLGRSIRTGESVVEMIRGRVGATVTLAVGATLFSIFVGVPAGVISAARRGSFFDTLAMLCTSLAISLPNFFTALVMITLFGVLLRVLPIAGYVSPRQDPWDALRHMVMPVVSLGLIYTALLSRLVRSELLDVLSEDYIRTARAKGLEERLLLIKHALRNGLIPAVNLVSLNFASLLGGSIIIEEIFALPGLGRVVVTAVQYRDFPVIQGVTITIGIVFVLSSILADLLSYWLDPRINLDVSIR